jgi:hypothetical protein
MTGPLAPGEPTHVHTDMPALDSPWCPVCDALLTIAIIREEQCDGDVERTGY